MSVLFPRWRLKKGLDSPAQKSNLPILMMKGLGMRRFCFRHLFSILAVCMIATSSYVLFDLLDIDGSRFKELAQVCGFEAVMPDSGEEIKPPTAYTPVHQPGPLRSLLPTAMHYFALASRPILPSISSDRLVHTRNATQSESASPAQGSEPAQRIA